MSREALPCAVCGARVENIDGSYINSPYAATAFATHGHYGSTTFDPMNGCYLELNICDSCIRRLRDERKILLGQDRKRVVTDYHHVVGWVPVRREMTPWQDGSERDEDFYIEMEDVGNTNLFPEIDWLPEAVAHIRHLLAEEANR